MAVPSRRLDLLAIPAEPDRHPDAGAFGELVTSWQREGVLDGMRAGPAVDRLLVGGFALLRLDLPGRVTLYANQLGGYRAFCPGAVTLGVPPPAAANVVPAFVRAVTAWRAGGDRVLECTFCGDSHELERVVLRPPGAFGRGAVWFADVQTATPSQALIKALDPVLGQVSWVWKRVR